MATPSPAATVVPLRDGPGHLEVLMLERTQLGARAFAGMWVFPGGQVDLADAAGSADEVEASRRAAVREALEEAGLELEEAQLVPLSFWCPPPEAPRRFATWFFLAPVEHGAEVSVDGREIASGRWLTPAAAISAREAGEMALAPPTFMTLWWLSRFADAESALSAAKASEPGRYLTRPVQLEGRLAVLLWEGDAGYDDGDTDRPGPRRRLWLDGGRWRVEIDG